MHGLEFNANYSNLLVHKVNYSNQVLAVACYFLVFWAVIIWINRSVEWFVVSPIHDYSFFSTQKIIEALRQKVFLEHY